QVESLADLKAALAQSPSRLEEIEGLGAKKLAQIGEAIEFAAGAAARHRLDEAAAVAEPLRQRVAACKGAKRVEVAGSFRRWRETVGDIDLLCEADEKHAAAIMDAFASAEAVTKVLAKGKTKSSVIVADRIQVDLRVVGGQSFGAALQYFTGSKAHNVALREIAVRRKLKLNEYGLFDARGKQLAGADEEGIYAALGLEPVPPELREDRGEVSAAAEGELPDLITVDDIRGDLHMHTTASDGHNTIEEMIQACRARRYKYMAVTEHSKGQIQANGLDEARLAKHCRAIRAAAKKYKDILVLTGIEVDILKDGRLDFADDVLAGLDFVTASPHGALAQKRDEATRRLIKAIENPHVDVIGHPSGRLIGRRAGMELDIAKIAAAAAANDTALEINAHPMRLDLRDVHIRAAVEAGAKLLICTDAHDAAPDGHLSMMPYGVHTARRGWARAADVINTWPPAKLKKWLART
ncbi:MAG: DNA polymerase/3'-5' exonuclease PolX, partial [Planctomycetota bacterium]